MRMSWAFLNLKFFKAILKFIEHYGGAEYAFNDSTNEAFVPYPDLEINKCLVVSGIW